MYIIPNLVDFISSMNPEYGSYFDKIGFDHKSLAGATVLDIGGMAPYAYADHIARTESGNFLDHETRVNGVFSSYAIVKANFTQKFGNIAATTFPDRDSLGMTVMEVNRNHVPGPHVVDIPFLAAYGGKPFKDRNSL